MRTPAQRETGTLVSLYARAAKHAAAYASLATLVLPTLVERRMLDEIADNLGSMMGLAYAAKGRVATRPADARLGAHYDSAEERMTQARAWQAEINAAIRRQRDADRGPFPA